MMEKREIERMNKALESILEMLENLDVHMAELKKTMKKIEKNTRQD